MNLSENWIRRSLALSGCHPLEDDGTNSPSPTSILRDTLSIHAIEELRQWSVRVFNSLPPYTVDIDILQEKDLALSKESPDGDECAQQEPEPEVLPIAQEVIANFTKVQNLFEQLKALLVANLRIGEDPLLGELNDLITNVGNRFCDILDAWEEQANPQIPTQQRSEILAAAREVKREKREHRQTVRQKHIQVLLSNKLRSAASENLSPCDISICDLSETSRVLEENEDLSNNSLAAEGIIIEPGVVCLTELLDRQSNGNPHKQYSDLVIKLSFILAAHGARVYQFLHQIFGLPSPSTIWRHWHKDLHTLSLQLTEADFLDQALLDCRVQYEIPSSEMIDAVLGVDAFSILPDVKPDLTNRSCFLFMIIPLKFNWKPFPIRLKPYLHGSADQLIQQEITNLLSMLARRQCFVHFVASDGDPGYSRRHQEHFLMWFKVYVQHYGQGALRALDLTLEHFSMVKDFPVLDLLHVAKNFRAKVIDYAICINPSVLMWTVSAPRLAEILNLGDVLTDTSQIGKMRDAYGLLLFTFHNAYLLLLEKRPMETLFILSIALPLASLRQEGICRDQRIFYAQCAFLIMMRMYALSILPRHEGVTSTWKRGTSQACLLGTESMWFRLLNTLFGLCLFLQKSDSSMSGNRFGTHTVENYIGLIRRLCCHYDDIRRVQHIVARAELVHRLMHELKIPISHRGRDNSGGSPFTENEAGRPFEPPFSPAEFIRTLCEHAGACVEAKEDDPYPRRPDRAAYLVECVANLLILNPDEPNPSRFGLSPNGRLKNPATHPSILARNAQYSGDRRTSESK
jgi:hypothetical protein